MEQQLGDRLSMLPIELGWQRSETMQDRLGGVAMGGRNHVRR